MMLALPWMFRGHQPASSSRWLVGVSALAIWSLSHVCVAAFDRQLWSPDRHPVRFYAPAVET